MVVDSTSYAFQLNVTFAGPPSEDAALRAWKDLFPKYGGFFRHPLIAPTRSDLAVFHQLHCIVSYNP
jgi:hypothetical protein